MNIYWYIKRLFVKIKSIKHHKHAKKLEDTNNICVYADTDSVYLDLSIIFESLGLDTSKYSEQQIKNFIIYNHLEDNDTLGIPHNFDLGSMPEEAKDKIISRLNELSDGEEDSTSIQNYLADIINGTMKRLMMTNLNCNNNRISFKREAVASRGIFLEKKRYVLWALNNEGVELSEKKRLKVTGIDIVRSTTPTFVKQELRQVIINILKNMDYDATISQLRDIHARFQLAHPKQISFTKSANGISKWKKKFKEDGKFKGTPQHVRGSLIYNDYLKSHKELRTKYDLIYDGDKVSLLYTKQGQDWTSDVFVFKERWLEEANLEEYIDRRRQFEVSMLNPVTRFFVALNWELVDFDNSDMAGLFEW